MPVIDPGTVLLKVFIVYPPAAELEGCLASFEAKLRYHGPVIFFWVRAVLNGCTWSISLDWRFSMTMCFLGIGQLALRGGSCGGLNREMLPLIWEVAQQVWIFWTNDAFFFLCTYSFPA